MGGTFCHLPSTFCMSEGPSINFTCVRVIPLVSVNFLRICVTFHQHFMHLRNLPSTSINILCPWDLPKTFCADLPSTSVNIFVVAGTSFNFQCFLQDLPSNSVNFSCGRGPYVDFCHFPCGRGTFHQYYLRPCVFLSSSFNFPCIRWNFCQLSVRKRDLP